MQNKKIVSFDIDGVLNNYPKCWVDYINFRLGTNFKKIDEAKFAIDNIIYDSIKEDYRLLGENTSFTIVNKDLINIINQFNKDNYFVIISTSRPINSSKYPDLYRMTFNWLEEIGVKFSQLIYKDENLTNHTHLLNDILFHIDDEIKYIELFKKFKIQSFLYSFEEFYLNSITIDDIIKIKSNAAIF